MYIKDFILCRSSVEADAFDRCPHVEEDEGAALSVAYVPFSEDGSVFQVAKQVEFEPLDVSFRTYDVALVSQLSQSAVKTYRGDFSSLINLLSYSE